MFPLLNILLTVLMLRLAVVPEIPTGVLMEYSTSRGGGVHRLLANGGFLDAAEGSSLMVYDTHSPSYSLAFEKRFAGPITDMALHKGFLYVTANHDGLTKWDIAIPIRPLLVGEYRPDDFFTAFHDLHWAGDTLFVAGSSAVWMLQEQAGFGPAFTKIGQVCEQMEGRGRVVAAKVLGANCAIAITGKEKGIGQGVHAFKVSPETRLNFQHYDAAEISGLLRLPGTQRVLAFGGKSATGESLLMAIDFQDALQPRMYWSDTVRGPLAAVGAGILQGDTLLVPLSGTLRRGCAGAKGAVALYDVHDPAQIRYLGQLVLPEAPQHLATGGRQLFVALGDAGIVGYDLRHWKAGGCTALAPNGRNPGSGGQCHGADALGDKLLTANGGAGMLLHLIQPRKTIATKAFAQLGKVEQVRILGDGGFAACWIADSLADSLVVIQLADGKKVGSLPGPFGHRLVLSWQGRIVSARDDKSGFDILDLRNPQKPRKEQTVLLNFNHISLDAQGRLVVTTEHNIRVVDLSLGGYAEMASLARWGEGFGAVASEGDALYVSTAKRGLVRYRLVKDSRGHTLREDGFAPLPAKQPQHMAIDAQGIYVAYNEQGVYALDKQHFSVQGYCRTGLDYLGRPQEGILDLFCKEGKIFVVEHYGQVTILQRKPQEQ
ncbi:MAG TPA: hypothetical protein VHS96_13455 [Bacteroidia bacterium]|nr:hypothetical protein [Bacteroidia bacterium]